MNAQPVFAANRTQGRLRTRARDSLQVPIALGFWQQTRGLAPMDFQISDAGPSASFPSAPVSEPAQAEESVPTF